MSSIGYISTASQVLVGLVTVGIVARILYIILNAMVAGDEIPDTLKKVKKKIAAAIFAVCLEAIITIIGGYYL